MDEEEMPQPDVSFWGACDRRVVGWTLRARCDGPHRQQFGARRASRARQPPASHALTHRDEPVAGAGMVVKPGKKSKTTIPESVQLHISAVRLSCSGALAPVSWRAA